MENLNGMWKRGENGIEGQERRGEKEKEEEVDERRKYEDRKN